MSVKTSNDASFKLLGLIAVEKKLITKQQLEEALKFQESSESQLGEILVGRGWVSRSQLKVLLDIHSLKIYLDSDVLYGQLVLINELANKEQVDKALAFQKNTSTKKKIGEVLIDQSVLSNQQRDAILEIQKRLTRNIEKIEPKVNCPVCDKEYVLKDPARFRKIRCRVCRMVFEVGFRPESIAIESDFNPYENENSESINPVLELRGENTIKITPKDSTAAKSSQYKALTQYMQEHDVKTEVELDDVPFFEKKDASGKYVFGREIARGGMGAILETRDNDIRRTVVTKVLLKNDSKEAIGKFIEEAQITGQLEHPNIVPVHEIGVNEAGQAYFTMKKVKGQTLLSIIERIKKEDEEYLHKYSVEELIETFLKVCDSIAFAHKKGVIHCDLKPENIMIGEYGEVMTMDWGLAKVKGKPRGHDFESLEEVVNTERTLNDKAKTIQGTIAGTPEYMSPEQARGDVEEISTQSDIYSLGGVLYTIVAHRLPVDGANVRKILLRVVAGEINPLPENVHPDLAAIIKKAMAVNLNDRYQTVYELRDDLIKYLRGYSVSAKEDSIGEMAMKLIRRNMLLTGVFVSVFMFFMLFMILLYKEVQDKETLILQQQNTLAELKAVSEGRSNDRRLSAPVIFKEGLDLLYQLKISEAHAKMLESESFDPDRIETKYYKGLTSLCMRDYIAAFDSFNEYDTKLALSKEKNENRFNVNILLKHIFSINQVGENSFDLISINKYITSEHPQVSSILNRRIDELLEEYERVILPIHSEVLVTVDERGYLSVDMSGLQEVTELPDLRKFPIVFLDLRGTKISNLNNLPICHIKDLLLDGCQIVDFSPLEKCVHLKSLSLSHTNFKDTALLNKLSVENLNISYSKITNIDPLNRLPLTSLNISGLSIKSIDALKGLPLKALSFGKKEVNPASFVNQISGESSELLEDISSDNIDTSNMGEAEETFNIAPLADMPLEVLHIYSSNVASISFLKGKKLRELDISNTWLNDILVLSGMPLKKLAIPGKALNSKEAIFMLSSFNLEYLSIKGSLPIGLNNNNFVVQTSSGRKLFEPISTKELCWESTELSSLSDFPFKGCEKLDLSKCIGFTSLDGVERLTELRKIILPKSLISNEEFQKLAKLKKLEKVVTAEYGELPTSTFFQFIKAK